MPPRGNEPARASLPHPQGGTTKKLSLDVSELRVESFGTGPREGARGTVAAHDATAANCPTCTCGGATPVEALVPAEYRTCYCCV